MKSTSYFILAVILFCALSIFAMARAVWADDPIMETTLDAPTVNDWIIQNNPPCKEWEKEFAGYGHLATDWQKECKRWRPWVCKPTGQRGVDIEHLPASFCSDK